MRSRLTVTDLHVARRGEWSELSGRVTCRRLGWRQRRLWFRLPLASAPTVPHGDPFAVGLLLPAMAARTDLRIDGPLSPSLLENLDRAQRLLTAWNPRNPWSRLAEIDVDGAEGVEAAPEGNETGLFFTGGVDSFYSLLHAREEVGAEPDRLVFVEGYDVPPDRPRLSDQVAERLSIAAEAAGTPLLRCATNLRLFTDVAVSWEMAHGAALGAMGHALGSRCGRWLISSADAYVSRAPYGTAAELDGLWSRTGLEFRSVGAGRKRSDKLAALASSPLVRQHLLVCWQEGRSAAVNCGHCAKCVRTMLQLLVLDALPAFPTLPPTVDPELLDRSRLAFEPVHRVFLWEDLLPRLRSRPEWSRLAAAVEGLVARSHRAERPPRPRDLLRPGGWRKAVEWMRRRVQPRLPIGTRRLLRSVTGRRRWRT